MKRTFAVLLSLFVTACVKPPEQRPSLQPSAPSAATSASTAAGWGKEVLAQIQAQYDNKVADCANPANPKDPYPAYGCSGVMLRATETSPAFEPWDPSPASIAKGAQSFTWIRADFNIGRLAYTYNHGFVIYPERQSPTGLLATTTYCASPTDADSVNRPDLNGCGENTYFRQISKPCEQQAPVIATAEAWVAHFAKYEENTRATCLFDLRPGTTSRAARFQEIIKAKAKLTGSSWTIQNEFRIETWPVGSGATVPLLAFFYVHGSQQGLEDTQTDQKRMYELYGRCIPIIGVTFPTSGTGRATFELNDADQAIPTAKCDVDIRKLQPSVPEASGDNGTLLTFDDYYSKDTISVVVPVYPGMTSGQTILVRFEGRAVVYHSPIVTVRTIAPISIPIPRSEIIDSMGRRVKVQFSVKRTATSPTEWSAYFWLTIAPQLLDGKPVTLAAPTISSDFTTVRFSTANLVPGLHTLTMRWIGASQHDSSRVDVGDTGIHNFSVPTDWVKESRGRTVLINVAAGRKDGGKYLFSQILRVNIPAAPASDHAMPPDAQSLL